MGHTLTWWRFLHVFNIISKISYHLPLRRAWFFIWKKYEFSQSLGYFMPSLVEIGKVVLEKKIKMWKGYGQTDIRTTDDMRSEKAHSSLRLRWANKAQVRLSIAMTKELNNNWPCFTILFSCSCWLFRWNEYPGPLFPTVPPSFFQKRCHMGR